MIKDVHIEPLKIFTDENGKVMHMLRNDSSHYKKFGEIYFSIINPGVVKGWKKHLKMTQYFVVPVGNIKLVIYDKREDSPTIENIQEICFGINNYQMVIIPPLLWYSFKAVGKAPAMIANCTDIPHDPHEVISIQPNSRDIPYRWNI